MNFLRHLKPRNSKINLTNLFSRGFASDTHKSTTVDAKEVEIFSRVHDWWDPYGSMRPLHAYNYARVNYMKRIVENHSPKPIANTALPFKGFDILDVGCGGGILCESLARLGGNTLGIDATATAIAIAQEHANRDPYLRKNLQYLNKSAEDIVNEGKKFDIVTSVEVIEHVHDISFFVQQLTNLTKKDGLVFISTINKTWLAYAIVILGAEYLTRVVPQGTHDYDKFIRPEQLTKLLQDHGCEILDVQGFAYNPLNNTMCESNDKSVNYFVSAKKL